MWYSGRQEDKVAAGRVEIAIGDMHPNMTAAEEDDLFILVNMLRVADLAGIQGGCMHIDIRQPCDRAAEDGPAFTLAGFFHQQLRPIENNRRSGFLSPAGLRRRSGAKGEQVKNGSGSAG